MDGTTLKRLLSSKRFLVIGVIILLVVIIVFSFYLNGESSIVSKNEIKEYIDTYIFKYKQLVENNIPESERNEYKLYSNNFGIVKGIISKSHGAAIFFNLPRGDSTIDIIDDKIEFYLWPNMKLSERNPRTNFFFIDENETVIVADPYKMEVGTAGAYIINGTVIYQNRMIAKGCNKKECWSIEDAKLRALADFLLIARSHISSEAELKKIQGRTKLELLANELAKMEFEGLPTSNTEKWLKKNEEYFITANETGINTEIARNLLETIKKESSEPKQLEKSYDYWIKPIIDGLIFLIVIAILNKIRKKYFTL